MLRHFIPRNDGRVCAFTLAEVLITLVIIGVIAALTIPNLMQKYQEQTTVKKVQKFYSTLSNAFSLALKDNGPVETWELIGYNEASTTKVYELLFKPYFKIGKNCGTDNTGNCISNEPYKQLNNEPIQGMSYAQHRGYYKLALDDGSAIVFIAATPISIVVTYDVNGAKGPNQIGRDAFWFSISNTIAVPSGAPNIYGNNYFSTHCDTSYASSGCTAWVIYKGNMDYLHCSGLNWNKNGCKDK